MTWTAYRVVFKLKSPLHIGCGKVGNVQRTRPYVTGRSFWGALTMRLTRDAASGSATDSKLYEEVGKQVHNRLAYTYFYPATKANSDYQIHFHWKDESQFRRQFLSSYASTALVYPQQAADEGLLHEVEFLSPRTLDAGKQVYLIGYVFAKDHCQLNWQEACCKLQMGGERGYGWGDVKCVDAQEITDAQLFDSNCHWSEHNGTIQIQLTESIRLLAHAVAQNMVAHNLSAQGEIEPLVGREWRESNRAGQHVENFGDICWVPGSIVQQSTAFTIGRFGLWNSCQSAPDRTSSPVAEPD
ncbi:hypothetical protein [Trichothermofontia sp.]